MCYLENVLHDLDIKFDIIATSETWLHAESNLSFFDIPGYDFCHVERNGKKFGGVALNDNYDCYYKVLIIFHLQLQTIQIFFLQS